MLSQQTELRVVARASSLTPICCVFRLTLSSLLSAWPSLRSHSTLSRALHCLHFFYIMYKKIHSYPTPPRHSRCPTHSLHTKLSRLLLAFLCVRLFSCVSISIHLRGEDLLLFWVFTPLEMNEILMHFKLRKEQREREIKIRVGVLEHHRTRGHNECTVAGWRKIDFLKLFFFFSLLYYIFSVSLNISRRRFFFFETHKQVRRGDRKKGAEKKTKKENHFSPAVVSLLRTYN